MAILRFLAELLASSSSIIESRTSWASAHSSRISCCMATSLHSTQIYTPHPPISHSFTELLASSSSIIESRTSWASAYRILYYMAIKLHITHIYTPHPPPHPNLPLFYRVIGLSLLNNRVENLLGLRPLFPHLVLHGHQPAQYTVQYTSATSTPPTPLPPPI
jgi:hypothetical protein